MRGTARRNSLTAPSVQNDAKRTSSLRGAKRSAGESLPALVGVLPIDRPDFCRVFFQRIQVHHPVENHGMKPSVRRIASFLRGDRSTQTEFRIRREHVLFLAFGSFAEIHVLMPLRDAQRNAL